jgi:MYXO-CTERM domain-containing protein
VTAIFMADLGLGLAAGTANPGDSLEAATATGVPMLQVALGAGRAEDIDVGTVRVSVTGASDETTTVTGVNLYVDVDGDGAYSLADTVIMTGVSFSGDDGVAVFNPSPAVRVPSGGTVHLLVTFNLNASAGDDFTASIASDTHVTAVGATSLTSVMPVGAPVTGGLKTVAAAGTPGSLEVRTGGSNPAAGTASPGETNVVLAQFTLRASSLESVNVSSLTLTGAGTGNEAIDVIGVSLHRDVNGDGAFDAGDTPIGTGTVYSADNGTLTFTGLTESIAASSQEEWIVVYDFASGGGTGTFLVQVSQPTDVGATGSVSAASVTVSGTPALGRTVTLVAGAEPAFFMGGCASGSSSPGGWAGWLLLALAALLAFRRRFAAE